MAGTSGQRGLAPGDGDGDTDGVPHTVEKPSPGCPASTAHHRQSPLEALIKWCALVGEAGGPPEAQSGRDNLIYCPGAPSD